MPNNAAKKNKKRKMREEAESAALERASKKLKLFSDEASPHDVSTDAADLKSCLKKSKTARRNSVTFAKKLCEYQSKPVLPKPGNQFLVNSKIDQGSDQKLKKKKKKKAKGKPIAVNGSVKIAQDVFNSIKLSSAPGSSGKVSDADGTVAEGALENDDADWEDMSDCDLDDEEKELFKQIGEDIDEVDDDFQLDLKAFMAEMDFSGAKKRMDEELAEKEVAEVTDKEMESSEEVVEDSKRDMENTKSEKSSEEAKLAAKRQKKLDKKARKKARREAEAQGTSVAQSTEAENSSSTPAPEDPGLAALRQSLQLHTAPPTGRAQAALALQDRLTLSLNAGRFRKINETLYTTTGAEALGTFTEDPELFTDYHDGFRHQVSLWPRNPLDTMVDWLAKKPATWVVGDFGCGEGELSQRVKQKVHSFDLVAAKPYITACDMAHVPLSDESLDAAVFCLALMGTNLNDFVAEANRTLKTGGILKIAEVQSRVTDMPSLLQQLQRFGFSLLNAPLETDYFFSVQFRKVKTLTKGAVAKLPALVLRPCLYKRR